MTATLASTARTTARVSVSTGAGTRRARGAAPVARPEFGGPTVPSAVRTATRRHGSAAACKVTSPAALRAGVFLKVKVAAVAVVALLGVGVSAAGFASWTNPDPSVEYVAGDPAWSHVSNR